MDEDRLADEVLSAEGPAALAALHYHLQRLARHGLLTRSVVAEGQRLATVLPMSPAFELRPARIAQAQLYAVSRFAYMRRDGQHLQIESPLAHCKCILHDPRCAALIAALATPGTPNELAERGTALGPNTVRLLLILWASAGLIEIEGTERSSLVSWEFHDLLFHARSRKGRSDAPFGGTYRFLGQIEPPPAFVSQPHEIQVPLFRPDLDQLERSDPSFTTVLERRRSVRTYHDEPISVRQLGEFFYRVARIEECQTAEVSTPRGNVTMTFAPRPYPSGGGLYELEFYAVVQACKELAPGLYHYQARDHVLERLSTRAEDIEQLLRDAAASAGVPAAGLQVLIVVTARFGRLMWKYESLAYSLILKHVGVVYQTMYLVATAMGLAPCALGGGDSDLFARAAATDYCEEASVGEFLLGSRPT